MKLIAMLALGAGAIFAQCSNASLNGNYTFTSSGTTYPTSALPAPLVGDFVSQGSVTYDGKGKVVLTADAAFNSIPQPVDPVPGTYSVNPDCTFTSQLENGSQFYGVVVNAGREVFVEQTNNGTALIGTAKLIDPAGTLEAGFRPSPCEGKVLSGVFGIRAAGTIGPPLVPIPTNVRQIRVGIVEFFTDGTLVVNSLVNTAGVTESSIQRATGTYQVLGGCRVKGILNLSVGLPFNGIITDAGREFNLIELIPGASMLVNGRVLQ